MSGTFLDLIDEQVRARPTETAVIAGGRRHTYAELDAAANSACVYVLDAGIRPGETVAVRCERSFALAALLIGVLRAGAAAVPVDPANGTRQSARVLADSRAELLIAEGDPGELGTAVRVATADEVFAPPGTVRARPSVRRDQLAYVVYTSGSTGEPKGIDVSHASIDNYVRWSTRGFGLAPGDRVLHLASIGFDVGLWEIFWPLTVGGCVVMADPGGHLDSAYLVHEVATRRVAVLHLTPPMLRRVIREPGLRYCSRLRTVVVSSDTLPTALLNEALTRLGGERTVHHMYGVTEVSVESTSWRAVPLAPDALPSIGTPISDTTVHLLDEDMRPVAGDGVGELYIGGGALAWGYRNRPGATARAFVPDPFAGGGARLYRTGDLARRQDGELVLVGRADRQVKVHGQRVDLGAVEAALESDVAVDVAVVETGAKGGLDAYVLAADARSLSHETLTGLASRLLPPHAVPTVFYQIDELPVTGNGKIDRHALSAGPHRWLLPARTDDEELSPLEATVGREVAAVLGLPAVGADDDFFALGGHSLLALELVDTLAARHGLRLAIRDVFALRTVRAIVGAGVVGAGVVVHCQKVDRQAALPLGAAQLDVWLAQHRSPELAAYNGGLLLHLAGPLHRERLAAAVDALVARHEMLRTRYISTVDGPRQVVDTWRPGTPPVLRERGRLARAAEDAFVRDELHRPFRLSAEWPLRVWLSSREDGTHVLLVVLHHLAADGASTEPLLHDLAELYADPDTSRPPAEEDYLDFTLGRRASGDEDLTGWWLRRLAGAPAAELPVDAPRPAERSGRGGVGQFELAADDYTRVRVLAAGLDTTPFVVLQTAVRLLLWRLTGQHDLVTVVPVSLRPPAAERIVGHFTTSLLVRADVASGGTVAGAVGRSRTALVEALDHPNVSVAELAARDGGIADLQRVVVAMQAEPVAHALDGLATRMIDVPTEAADFDLQFTFTERAGDAGLLVELRYDGDLFHAGRVRQFWDHFRALLVLMLADPQRPLDEVTLVDPVAGAASIDADGPAVPLPYCCTPALFAAIARDQPDAPALRTADRMVSYAELDAEVERVAAGLCERGLPAGSVVGVLADRTPEAITALLAILRGGQIYLPLRSNDSAERLRAICADGGASLVVDCTAGGRVEHDLGVPVLDLAALRSAASPPPPGCPAATDGAYLLFTSGSTGRAKGVLVGHRALLNRLLWARRTMEFGPGDQHLQKTALDFDVAVAEILQPFTSGGSLALAAPGAERDPSHLLDEVRKFGITVMHFVPSVLRAVLDSGLTLPTAVRMVMCSGEALPSSAAEQLLLRHPWIALHNTYGPTETTIEMTHHIVTRTGDRPIVTIGRPIDNVGARVLDPALREQPVMVPGELYVSGAAVAAGYLGRSRLTADKFVPDPYSGEPGARMYATGDICFRDDTGLLHFVERADRQVKVRGLRLELGAIETAIAAHPQVRQCAAVVETMDGLGQRLTAYLAVPDDVDLDLDAVRRQALRILPQHALPDRFVRLTDIPLTSAGKLDRAAAALAGQAIAAPRPALEPAPRDLVARVGEIWASVLAVDQVGADDDFFALGGHSLLAAQCAARLGAGFGTGAPVAGIFRHPRLSDFCSWWADYVRQAGQEPVLPPVADRGSRLPLSGAQLRLWLVDQTTGPGHDYDLALGWLAPGVTADAVAAALAQVVATHEVFRTGYLADDDGPYQRIHEDWRPDVLRHDDRTVPARSLAARLLAMLRARPFDLTSGVPPVAAAVGSGAEGTVLVLNLHHIVLDGASIPLVTSALADAIAGRAPRVPQRQYADFAAWEAASGPDRFTDGLRYWLRELGGAKPLTLPSVGSAGGSPAAAAGRLEATLSPEVTAGLSATGTVFAGLLTAFAAATHCLTQEDDLVIGTDAANRLLPGTDEMIGFFVNQLPLRLRVAPEEELGQLLRRVGAIAVAGLEHQHVPFEAIVEELQPPRRPGRTPLIVAKLVLQNAQAAEHAEIVELPDVDLAPSAKFDLVMGWTPTDGGMYGVLEFATDTVTPALAGWFVSVFTTCATAIVDEPRLTVAGLGVRVAAQVQTRLRAGRVLRSRPLADGTNRKGG